MWLLLFVRSRGSLATDFRWWPVHPMQRGVTGLDLDQADRWRTVILFQPVHVTRKTWFLPVQS